MHRSVHIYNWMDDQSCVSQKESRSRKCPCYGYLPNTSWHQGASPRSGNVDRWNKTNKTITEHFGSRFERIKTNQNANNAILSHVIAFILFLELSAFASTSENRAWCVTTTYTLVRILCQWPPLSYIYTPVTMYTRGSSSSWQIRQNYGAMERETTTTSTTTIITKIITKTTTMYDAFPRYVPHSPFVKRGETG